VLVIVKSETVLARHRKVFACSGRGASAWHARAAEHPAGNPRSDSNDQPQQPGAGNFFSMGPGISLPIFNAGRIRMNIDANDPRLEQAVHAYEAEILAAFEETENAFVSRDSAEAKMRELENGFEAAVRSVELAQELYLRVLSDFLSVLDAQRQRFQIERELAASRTDLLRSTVALYKALGE